MVKGKPKNMSPALASPVKSIAYTLTIFAGNAPDKAIAFPNNPSEITWEEDFPTNVEYTFGAIPKREHNAPKRWKISISGRTGVQSRTMYEGDKKSLQPLEILTKFGEFLEYYQGVAAIAGASQLNQTTGVLKLAAHVRMVLSMSKEAVHLFVEPGTFSFNRQAASTRQSASWSVNFTAWGKADALWPTAGRGYRGPPHMTRAGSAGGSQSQEWLEENPYRAKRLQDFIGAEETWQAASVLYLDLQKQSAQSQLDAYRKASAQLAPGTGGPCVVLERALIEHFPKTQKLGGEALAFAQDVYMASIQFRRAVQDFRTQVQAGVDVLRVPQRTLQNMAAGAANIRAILQDIVNAGEYVANGMGVPEVLSMLYMSENACSDSTVLVGAAGGKFKGLPSDTSAQELSGALTDAEQGFGAPFILPAAVYSWMDVARAVYGDESFWIGLAKLNGAKDAYSNSQGKPLQPGDTVFLASDGGALISGGQPTADSFYLTDFLLTPSGGMSSTGGAYLQGSGTELLSVSGVGSDLQTVTGYGNLVQAMTTLAQTPQGSLIDDQSYGLLRVSPGDTLGTHAAATAMALARAQILSDFRVADVTDTEVEDLRDGIALKFTVVPSGANADPLTVIAPLPSL